MAASVTRFRRPARSVTGSPSPGASARWTPNAILIRPWLVFALVTGALLPWVGYLAWSLPMDQVAAHWRLAWVGFDAALAVTCASAAIAARRHSRLFRDFLVAAAVLLLCDAWFDIVTAASAGQLAEAVVEAAAAELPFAVVCLTLARRLGR